MNKITLTLCFMLGSLFGQRVVGYYPKWMQDEFPVSEIDLSVVTHVIHAFAWPDIEGNVLSYSNMLSSSHSETIHAGGGKFLLALGGWGNDVGFATVAADAQLRSTFINNLIDICDTYGYDGIDMDWEYPQSNNERQNLNYLIAEMDSSFNEHNPDWLITMAVPVSNWSGQWFDFSFLKLYVDFFNAMTYDMHGSWTNDAGHNSPLYQSPPGDSDGSCETAMNYLINTRGIPEDQINLGLPFWGKRYYASDINQSFTCDVADKRYNEIPNLIGNGWEYNWDNNAHCPYLRKDDYSRIITYDDPESIGYKCEYAIELELGGVMIWALGYDETTNGQALIQSIDEYFLGVGHDDPTIVPNKLSLKAYPNPFNPSCRFEFDLGQAEMIQLNIYSVTGENVVTLIHEKLDRGNHIYYWNGKNARDNSGSSLYFAELLGERSKIVKKIVYLK
ncbi:MAG: glycoside hydrolase family 18 protein [Candidatus Marinimicrobia bacterium]|nr:glycoside hydrolase family 18 protein [Candidatus Neomarinimicrobiota bacterium]